MPAPQTIDLLIHGSSEVVTPLGQAALTGAELGGVAVTRDGALAVDGGRILEVGTSADLQERYTARTSIDAEGGTVLPGLVDAHTHPVFMGTREEEFELRAAGKTYVEISAAGGGIASSLEGVRTSSEEVLLRSLLERARRFLALGTTTVEAKTGYGLTLEDELKGLRVIQRANAEQPVDFVATCLAAHAYPPEYADRREDFHTLIVEEIWPAVVAQGIARYADIFTEEHVFDLDSSRRIMISAREAGLDLRMHADQLTPLGGAQLAAELGARSADHLEHISPVGIEALAGAGVVATLSPLVPLFLRESAEAPGRALVEGGVPVALSTDFNPGSCYCMSMFEVLSWASLRYGFSAAEALTAGTLNAAASLDLAHEIGSLEVGKRADIVITDLPNHLHLTYELGRNPVRAVVKDGQLAWQVQAPSA
jgi:imidazolonepropionase